MVKSQVVLSHVAFLVPSVEKAAVVFSQNGFVTQAPQVWEGEGTKEIYVGDYDVQSALPLLVEPAREGSYSRALQKRGPGFHHIAIDVLNLEKYIQELEGSGWFLHMNSLRTIRQMKTAYLARPGMPTMIEVQEKEALLTTPPLIEELHMILNPEQLAMIKTLGLNQVHAASEFSLTVNNQKKIYFKELF